MRVCEGRVREGGECCEGDGGCGRGHVFPLLPVLNPRSCLPPSVYTHAPHPTPTQGDVTLHWTVNTPSAPPNACTGTDSAGKTVLAVRPRWPCGGGRMWEGVWGRACGGGRWLASKGMGLRTDSDQSKHARS